MYNKRSAFIQLVKKVIFRRKMTIKISFLSRLCRGKKHFYPRKCRRQRLRLCHAKRVRAAWMFRRKSPLGLFRRSEPILNRRKGSIMKFTCSKEALLAAVQITSKAASGKTTMPSLEGVLMELEGNTLTITGYDLDMGIKTSIGVNGMESGNTIINAKMAGDIIRKMPSGDINFQCDQNNIAEISGKETNFSVMCMEASNYPNVPQVNSEKSFSMPQRLLKNMINGTKFAVAVNDSKPALMGCKFEIEDNVLSVAAVDGVRIALRQEPLTYNNISFIIPAKTLDELTHILSDDDDKNVTLSIDKNQISFKIDNYIMISRLLDGDFISYKNYFK